MNREQEPWWSAVSRMVTVTAAPVLQAAADGQWESPEAVPLTGDPDAVRALVARVARAARTDVAVEILWPGQAFVGVEWPAGAWAEAAAAAALAIGQGHTVEAGLLALLGTTPGAGLELAELGAVNAWWSVGPHRLWQRGEPRPAQVAGSVPARLATCAHPLAVELAVADPRPCWVGIHVSTESGRLDPARLEQVLRVVA